MLAQTASFMSDSEAVKKEGGRIRRKSKELEAELSGMQEASEQWVALAGVGRPRRNSKEFTDEELEAAFKEMDADGSGAIDPEELENAIRKMDPTISKAKCAELVQWADEDGDGECVPPRAPCGGAGSAVALAFTRAPGLPAGSTSRSSRRSCYTSGLGC